MTIRQRIFKVVLWLFAIIGATAVVFAIVAFLAMRLAGWSKQEWPAIQNAGQLASDCRVLLAAHPDGGEVPPSDWPKAIQNLQPRHVNVGGDAVYILISSGGIGSGWGYLVCPTRDGVSGRCLRGLRVWGTEHEKVFKFLTNE